MAERDDIETICRAWQDIDAPMELSVTAALLRRRIQAAVLLAEAAFGAIGLAAAVYFALVGGIVHRVAAVLVVGASVLGVMFVHRRVRLLRWADWTPDGVLAFRLKDCDVALLTARCALLSGAVLVGFAVFVWLAADLGWDDMIEPEFAADYAAVVALVVVPLTVWALWRLRTKRAERDRLLALLAEFEKA